MAKSSNQNEKIELHPRNKNRERYDLSAMVDSIPALKKYITKNKRGDDSINFSNPAAVKLLNKAILKHYYGINYWEFPDENLCPPIPGRADYIHYAADLLAEGNNGIIPKGEDITCLDIGTGASCIYPILGDAEYQWNFIATDTHAKSLKIAKKIINSNTSLNGKVDLRLQSNPQNIFQGVIQKEEKIDITICNPPFHASMADAKEGTKRKLRNLNVRNGERLSRNFSGEYNELIYPGGELQFITNMISESEKFAKNCKWFSSLVSKNENLKKLIKLLEKSPTTDVRKIQMKTGNKVSRILAWTF